MDPASNGASRRQHPFPWLNSLATEPFYLVHLLVFFSYFAARSAACQQLSGDLSNRLLRREIQAILTFFVLAAIKIGKEETWEAFISDTLLYAKGLLFALSLIIDYHLALCYLLAFTVIFVVAQQPPYDGLGHCNQLTPLQLETVLTEGNSSRFWLVEFRTSCSLKWACSSRLFADLSTVYSNKNFSFGIVDLGQFPNVADKFGISLWGQLPVYILFDKAVEIARYPDIMIESKTLYPPLSKKFLCQYFELDRRLVEYLSK